MALTYPPEFWARAFVLASLAPKQCEQCHGFTILKREGRRTVCVVLTEPGKPLPHNLRLLCTSCFPDAREVKVSRAKIMSMCLDLFQHEAEKEERRRGRNAHSSVEA